MADKTPSPYLTLFENEGLGTNDINLPNNSPSASNESPYLNLFKEEQENNDKLLNQILQATRNANQDPNKVGEAQVLGNELGLPGQNNVANLDQLRQMAAKRNAERQNLAKYSPVLARQLIDPDFAAIAHDDTAHLSTLENMFIGITELPENSVAGWEAGKLTAELGRLGNKAQRGNSTPEIAARIVEINKRMKELHAEHGVGFWNSAAEFVGQMSTTVPDALITGGYTAMAAGTTASMLSVGPQAAVAPITVGSATLAGFFAGFGGSMGTDAYIIESGHSYLEMINAGIEEDIAQYASTGVGLVNASLEVVGISFVAAPIKKALLRKISSEMADAMKKPSMATAMREFGGSYAQAWLGEVSTEVLQEISAMAGQEIAQAFSEKEFQSLLATDKGREEIAKRLVGIFEKVGKGMALLAIPGASISFASELSSSMKSQKEQDFINGLIEGSGNSKVKGRNPEAFKQYIQAVAQDNGVDNIYIDAGMFNQALIKSGVTVEQLEVTMPDVANQLKEALETGTSNDILIPTGEFAAKIAGTELADSVKPHIRVSEDSFSLNEAKQFAQEREFLQEEATRAIEEQVGKIEGFKESAAQVRATILDQLKETAVYAENVNNSYADHVRDFVVTQAAELGIDPMTFYNQYAYRIFGGRQASPAQRSENLLAQEIFDQQGNVRTDSKAFQDFYGNSMLKDDQGAPLVLYHGTADNIDAFDLDHPNRGDTGWLGTGVYMSDSPILAKIYAEGKQRKKRTNPEMSDDQDVGAQIMPLYARLENPYRSTLEEKYKIRAGGRAGADAFTAKLIAEGYDGVIMPIDQESNEIVVFDPKMVKSVNNSGTWSTETADLLKQQGPISPETGKESGLVYEFVPEGQIPTETRTAYKLMKVQKNRPGLVFPLYAKPESGGAQGYTGRKWFLAENQRPTIGNKQLAERPGIHAVNLPVFDQGKGRVKGQQRVWVEVNLPAITEAAQAESNASLNPSRGQLDGITDRLIGPEESYDYKTNPNASNDAGGWPIAGSMQVVRVIPDSEIKSILTENGLEAQIENSLTGTSDAQAQNTTQQLEALGASFDTEGTFNQGGMPAIEGASTKPGNSGGFMPYLRVTTKEKIPAKKKPLFAQETKNTTAVRQIAAIDEVLERHPDPVASPEAWGAMMTDALATNEVPVPPYNFIANMQDDAAGSIALLNTLSPGQITDADHGFENAAGFRDDYINGRISIEDTGKLFLWSFLSRGVSPYTQEGLFIDSFYGVEPWITLAAEGNFDPDGARLIYPEMGTAEELSVVLFERALSGWETSTKAVQKRTPKPKQSDEAFFVEQTSTGPAITYRQWASTTAPKGSGQPGAGAAHNLNAFGATFMKKMSQSAGDGTNRTRMQVLHEMMSDPASTGKSVRRKFLEMGEGVGIDNKVVSFTLLVAGFDDVLVLDRVQIREMWNDGRFDDVNLYDGFKTLNEKTGKSAVTAGSMLSSLTYGGRGLLVYEALENALLQRVDGIYEAVGRPQDASAGRYHWETWVASSNQEASHATIDAILAASRGANQPLEGVTAKEGEYGAYAYGARYGRNGNSVPYFLYSVPGKGDYRFTVDGFTKFMGEIKKAKNKVVPAKGFKVTESGNQPWYMRPEVDLDNLDVLANQLGEKYEAVSISDEDVSNGIDQPITNRLTTNTALDGDILRQSAIGDGSPGASTESSGTSTESVGEDQGRTLTAEELRAQSEQGAVNDAAVQGASFDQTKTDGSRGNFDPKRLTTMLNQDADYSTFLHETGHFFLTVYADMAALPNATPRMIQDMQTLLDWFGIKDLATWNALSLNEQRKYHEQFAYSYEIYLFEGKAPSTKMQDMFDKFSRFLRSVYQNIRDELNLLYRQENGTDLPILTDEIRSVMDRMLASEEQITQAESVFGMKAMFGSQEESGMTDTQWAEYQEAITAAHNDAVSSLTASSMRQVKWLDNARTKVLKKLQSQARAQRKIIREEEMAKARMQPNYRMSELIKRGTSVNEKGEVVSVGAGQKLSIEGVKNIPGLNLTPEQIKQLGYGKYGILAKEGMPVDVAAEMYGYSSAKEMVETLLNTQPINELVSERTDTRMLAEFGELTDPKAMELEVQKSLHNEARARFISVELSFLEKSGQPVRYQTAAARQIAKDILRKKVLRDVRPSVFSRNEKKASKEAEKASRRGEPGDAVSAKRNQLLQNQLAREATLIQEEFKKALVVFRKIFKGDKKVSKTRNIDLINAARSILSAYGLGPVVDSPSDYVDKLKAYNPDFYTQLEPLILEATQGGKDLKDMSVDKFRSLVDLIKSLDHLARQDKMLTNEGKMFEVQEVVDAMTARMEEIGVPDVLPGETSTVNNKAKKFRSINNGKAMLRRMEHWVDSMDGEAGYGVFTKFIWRPVKDAVVKYRDARNSYVKRYSDLVHQQQTNGNADKGKISASEINYTFGAENGGIGKYELLGAMLHMGNPSNFEKLLLGRKWGFRNEDGTLNSTSWKTMIDRMIDEGILTKADFDFLQEVWNLNEELKPLAQKAHRDIYGYYFNEVEASVLETPFGTYAGGYVPAKTDAFMVDDARRNAAIEELEGDFRQSMPSTGMGFTQSRVEYNKPLSLDIRVMTKHIDDVLRFAYIQPAIKDVLKIVKNREFSEMLTKLDPSAIQDMIIPWLNRTARQTTVTPGMNKSLDRFWQTVRNRTGVGIMFGNLTNAFQQLTGYFLSAIKVDGKYLRGALASYMSRPQKSLEEVAELSPFMADRQQNQIFDIQETLNDLLLNPTAYDKIQKWSQKHGYFLQQAFQNQVDTVTWIGAYNQTLAELGADVTDVAAQKEAVYRADAAVRLTQDSLSPEDLAAFQVGSPLYKTLIQFGGYFNMLANVNATEYTKIFRDLGWRGNKGRLFMTYLLGFAGPMLVADAMVRTLGGDWDDDDDDGYLDVMAEWFFGSQLRGAAALVPFGNILLVPFNSFNDKPYDDRISTSPSISVLEAATVGTVRTVINIASDDKDITGKNVRDVLTLMSLITGIPLTILGRPLGYAIDVESGKYDPNSDVDYVRGLITGKASSESRRN